VRLRLPSCQKRSWVLGPQLGVFTRQLASSTAARAREGTCEIEDEHAFASASAGAHAEAAGLPAGADTAARAPEGTCENEDEDALASPSADVLAEAAGLSAGDALADAPACVWLGPGAPVAGLPDRGCCLSGACVCMTGWLSTMQA